MAVEPTQQTDFVELPAQDLHHADPPPADKPVEAVKKDDRMWKRIFLGGVILAIGGFIYMATRTSDTRTAPPGADKGSEPTKVEAVAEVKPLNCGAAHAPDCSKVDVAIVGTWLSSKGDKTLVCEGKETVTRDGNGTPVTLDLCNCPCK